MTVSPQVYGVKTNGSSNSGTNRDTKAVEGQTECGMDRGEIAGEGASRRRQRGVVGSGGKQEVSAGRMSWEVGMM